jgi:hypothetical protein
MDKKDPQIIVEPLPFEVGENVRIRYKGCLNLEIPSKIFLHLGYGEDSWNEIEDIPMRKNRGGSWTTSFMVKDEKCLKFCFHDNQGNWDNNQEENWSYDIH